MEKRESLVIVQPIARMMALARFATTNTTLDSKSKFAQT